MQKMQEMWVRPLSQEDPLEKEMATHSVFLPENPMDRGALWATVHRVTVWHHWATEYSTAHRGLLIYVEGTSVPQKGVCGGGRQVYLKQLTFHAEMWLCYWQYSGVSLKGSHFWRATEGGKWRGRWGLMGRTEHSLSPARTVSQAGIRFTYISNSHCVPSAYSRPAVLRNTSQERRWGTNSENSGKCTDWSLLR